MYTALERGRSYRIGKITLVYLGRIFPEDHPPCFTFVDPASGEQIDFSLAQLTSFEETGNLRYLGILPLPLEPT